MTRLASIMVVGIALAVPVIAQRSTPASPPKSPGRAVVTHVTCSNDLGVGTKTARRFCDVAISTDPAQGVVMTIPRHVGSSTLRFDLHNRFPVLPDISTPGHVYVRHMALVVVMSSSGEPLGRGAVLAEMRSDADLFDHIVGSGIMAVKAVAPGAPESVRVVIPAAVSSISIVGLRLETMSRDGPQVFDTPGRPIAIVSNLRIDYQPVAKLPAR